MMAYEDGLRLLASLETPKSPDMAEEDYRGWLDDLIASKYTYIVASQVWLVGSSVAASSCLYCRSK